MGLLISHWNDLFHADDLNKGSFYLSLYLFSQYTYMIYIIYMISKHTHGKYTVNVERVYINVHTINTCFYLINNTNLKTQKQA